MALLVGQLEQALTSLKELRQRQQQTYSLVPYLGKRGDNRKPLYVECNAVSPATVRRIADVVAATGCPFADAGIIGPPPKPGDAGPRLYVSGPQSRPVEALATYGLDVRAMDGALGDASALKMSYGGLTKGLTALGSALVLGANRAGVADALHAELAASQPALLAYLTRSVPAMFSKPASCTRAS